MTNARTTDPVTSLEAAADTAGRRLPIAMRLLAAYAKAGKNGLTAEQAADIAYDFFFPWEKFGTWKRVSELKKLGYVNELHKQRKGGTKPVTRTTTSGRQAMVLHINARGKAALKDYRDYLKSAA